MRISKISSRNFVFSFDLDVPGLFTGVTNVLVINTENYYVVCDTFLGPNLMNKIDIFLQNEIDKKPFIIFNSHSDWDHIWGNCYFKDSEIIGHERLNLEIKSQRQIDDLKRYDKYKEGDIELLGPTITFKEDYLLMNEGIEFFYSPGHTLDSSSCFDSIDKVLFVGDNVESPNPSINFDNLKQYIETLERYLKIPFNHLVTGHDKYANRDSIIENIKFLKKSL